MRTKIIVSAILIVAALSMMTAQAAQVNAEKTHVKIVKVQQHHTKKNHHKHHAVKHHHNNKVVIVEKDTDNFQKVLHHSSHFFKKLHNDRDFFNSRAFAEEDENQGICNFIDNLDDAFEAGCI